MKTSHTHRGNCQACGALQAVGNTTQLVAKHGYKVAGFGFFNGTCNGSDRPPAQISVKHTHDTIFRLRAYAVLQSQIAQEWLAVGPEGRYLKPAESYQKWNSKLRVERKGARGPSGVLGGYVTMPITAETPLHVVQKEQIARSMACTRAAQHAKAHVGMLLANIVPLLGEPLKPGKPKAPTYERGMQITAALKVYTLVTPWRSPWSKRQTGWRTLCDGRVNYLTTREMNKMIIKP